MTRRLRGLVAGAALALGPVAGWGAATGAPDAVTVAGAAGNVVLTAAQVAAMPAVEETVSFKTEHGPMKADFSGPLLWTVLQQAKALDVKKKDAVRRIVLITGADGYVAVLALGEIAPQFEGKAVILGDAVDGKPLAAGDLRLVVPGDSRGGRSVRDVVRITILDAAAQH